MAHPDFSFKITDEIRLDVDLARKRAVILLETEDGKLIQLKAGYQTIIKIHDEIRKQIEAF